MKKTIKYFLLKRRLFIGVVTGIVFLITAISVPGVRNFIVQYKDYDGFWVARPLKIPFGTIVIAAALLSLFLPVYEMNYKMNKVVVDQIYSLPVTKEKYYLAKYIVGLIEITIPILVSTIYVLICILFSKHLYNLLYVLPFVLTLLIYSYAVFTISSFFFSRCNTIVDGLVNIGFVTFFITAFLSIFWSTIKVGQGYVQTSEFILFTPFNNIFNIFDALMRKDAYETVIGDVFDKDLLFSRWIPIITYVVIGIGLFFLSIYIVKKDKAEDATQLSTSYFSYKVFIPAYVALLTILSYSENGGIDLSYIVLIAIAGFVGYICYRRSVKIKKYDFIVLGSTLVAALIIGMFI